MMLKYSCTNTRLVNWVLRQINDQPGLIFPKRKGWNAHLKLVYPGDQNQAYFIVLVSNQTELLVFIPLNNKVEQCHLKCISNIKSIRNLKNDFGNEHNSYQLIFMTCEKYEETVSKLLKSTIGNYNLLMLDYEKISFVKGNFMNPRLEYRLSSQTFDTDLIPNLLPEEQQSISDGIANSLFYQNLFYNLNHLWLTGSDQVDMRTILKHSIPYWKHYRKKDQQEIIDQVGLDLEQVFERFAFDGFGVNRQAKPSDSIPMTMVQFPKLPENRKELNILARKLDLALEYFRDKVNQFSIDSLELDT